MVEKEGLAEVVYLAIYKVCRMASEETFLS